MGDMEVVCGGQGERGDIEVDGENNGAGTKSAGSVLGAAVERGIGAAVDEMEQGLQPQ